MNAVQDLLNIALNHIYSKITDTIMKLIMSIDRSIFLKKHVSRNIMWIFYITILLRQFTKTLNQFLNWSMANENLKICMPILFEQLKESKQFWGTFFGSKNTQ